MANKNNCQHRSMYCTGEDVRIIQIRQNNNKPFSHDDEKLRSCKECRLLHNGSWKYIKEVSNDKKKHIGFWIKVDVHPVHVLADGNMSKKTEHALINLVRAVVKKFNAKEVSNG
jgi:hypothetical protein